mgnify:CR=1 FL=1
MLDSLKIKNKKRKKKNPAQLLWKLENQSQESAEMKNEKKKFFYETWYSN